MLSGIRQRKINSVRSHLHVESYKEKNDNNKKKQGHRCRERIGGCQRHGVGDGQNAQRGSKGTNFQL